MADTARGDDQQISHFRLLLWLKFRLVRGAYRRDKATLIGTIIMLIVFLPLSFGGAYFIYKFAVSSPTLAPFILRDVLTTAYLFWFVTPLLGFSLNDSYDPTRLFIYPVRYQTIFAANVLGSLFEISTLLFLPILIALLVATATTVPAFLMSLFLLLVFLLQTIALGQAVTLALIGVLKSRRFRDIMIVVLPMLALVRYFIQTHFSEGVGLQSLLNSPAWKVAGYLPPGWTATAMTASESGSWLSALGGSFLLLATAAITVALAAFLLRQLFTGERGTSLSVAQAKNAAAPVTSARSVTDNAGDDLKGNLGPVLAVAEKEWRYLIRDPQYKALGTNILYFIVVFGLSFSRMNNTGFNALQNGSQTLGFLQNLLHVSLPLALAGFILLATMPLTFNIFGGEGAACTMLFSFPINRRLVILGKNLAQGSVVFAIATMCILVVSFFMHNFDSVVISISGMVMALMVMLAAGNLISVRFPNKLIVRGGRLSRGGQLNVGGSAAVGSGCGYRLLYLLCWLIAMIVEIPAAAAIVLPGVGLISPDWYTLTIPLGFAYSIGLYWLSLTILDTWMVTQEYFIISKLAPSD